jgi:hypothetical protein
MGHGLRSNARPAHLTVVALGPNGARAHTWVGLTTASGGTAKLDFPAAWTVNRASTSFSGGPAGGADVEERGDGVQARLALGPGEFGMLEGEGPAPLKGGLEVTAQVENGQVTGTIVNRLPFGVNQVVVATGQGAASTRDLRPGESTQFTLPVGTSVGSEWDPVASSLTNVCCFASGDSNLSPPAMSMLVRSLRGVVGPGERPDVVAVWGFASDYQPPVRLAGGHGGIKGRTLVMSSSRLPKAVPDSSPRMIQGTVTDFGMGRLAAVGSGDATVVRIDVDPATSATGLALPAVPAEVWAGGKWVRLNAQFPNTVPGQGGFLPTPQPGRVVCQSNGNCVQVGSAVLQGGPSVTVPLPDGAVWNGRVYVRFGPGQSVNLQGLRLT